MSDVDENDFDALTVVFTSQQTIAIGTTSFSSSEVQTLHSLDVADDGTYWFVIFANEDYDKLTIVGISFFI